MVKIKKKFVVNMVSIDLYGNFLLQINNTVYSGKLPAKVVWDDRLQFIKNRGILIKEIKAYTKLKKTDLLINNGEKNVENYSLF